MQANPDPAVVTWLDDQPAAAIWLTSITIFEARYGLALLRDDFKHQVVMFESAAADQAALLAAQRKAQGRGVDMRDTCIAGIAQAKRATLATRNVRHFDDLNVPVINPWAQAS